MKRVRHIVASGKHATLKLTIELTSKKETSPIRSEFIAAVDGLTSNLMLAVHQGSDIPLTHIKMK
jgi:hypothetical protein